MSKEFENILIPNDDFYIKDYKILSLNKIKSIYNEIDKNIYSNIESITERMKIRILKTISDNYDKIIFSINEQMHNKFENAKTEEEKRKIIKTYDSVKKEIKRQNSISLKRYFIKSETKILTLYNMFLNNLEDYLELDEYMINERDITLKKLKKKIITFEDLGALLYLKYKMSENKEYKKFKYVVVDEAQYFTELNFYCLKKIMPIQDLVFLEIWLNQYMIIEV